MRTMLPTWRVSACLCYACGDEYGGYGGDCDLCESVHEHGSGQTRPSQHAHFGGLTASTAAISPLGLVT